MREIDFASIRRIQHIVNNSPVPLYQKDIAHEAGVSEKTLVKYKQRELVHIPERRDWVRAYASSQFKKDNSSIHRIRMNLSMGPIGFYDLLHELDPSILKRTDPKSSRISIMLSEMQGSEKTVAELALAGMSPEEIAERTEMVRETARKYIAGLGLYNAHQRATNRRRHLQKNRNYSKQAIH